MIEMQEIIVKIPEELDELRHAASINWQLVIGRRLKEEFEELSRIKRIVTKSKLTQEQAEKLADEVSLSLAKRYEDSVKEKG